MMQDVFYNFWKPCKFSMTLACKNCSQDKLFTEYTVNVIKKGKINCSSRSIYQRKRQN